MTRCQKLLTLYCALFLVIALWFAAWVTLWIERDIQARATEKLIASGAPKVDVNADGTILELAGVVSSVEQRADIARTAETVRNVRYVVNNLQVIAPRIEATPVFTLLKRDPEMITLSGDAPNGTQRRAVEDALTNMLQARKAAGHEVEITVVPAVRTGTGEDNPEWQQVTIAAAQALIDLRVGDAELERIGKRLALNGTAADGAERARIEKVLRAALPAGWQLSFSVDAPIPLADPFLFRATIQDRVMTIRDCMAPDDGTLAQMRSEMVQHKAKISDCPLMSGSPNAAWGDAVAHGLRGLAKLVQGEVNIRNTQISLTGMAPAEVDAKVMASTWQAEVPKGYQAVAGLTADIPVLAEFRLTAQRVGGLAGLVADVDSEATQKQFAAELGRNLANGNFGHDFRRGQGAPAGWANFGTGALAALARHDEGRVELRGQSLTLYLPGTDAARAQVATEWTAALAPLQVQVLPYDPIMTIREAVLPGAFALDMRRNPDDSLRISGTAPDTAIREAVLAYAIAKFTVGKVDATALHVTPGTAEGWQAAVTAMIDAARALTVADVHLRDRLVALQGKARDAATREAVLNAAKAAIPNGWVLRDQIEVGTVATAPASAAVAPAPTASVAANPAPGDAVSARDCVAALNKEVATSRIEFESGSAQINDSSTALLDRLSEVLRKCPTVTVQVEGHTDDRGDQDQNMQLSRDRAAAVRVELVRRGINPERLTAIGFGETKPIASNATSEGRAQNRRIEFSVRE